MTPESAIHAYQMIPLDVAGYILGSALLVGHLIALMGGTTARNFVQSSPRNHLLAQITLGLAFAWFFLLVAPADKGLISSLRVDLAEFEGVRWLLQLGCPLFFILLVTQVKELLFPRALGFLGLMLVAPFVTAAFLKLPQTRLLIPIWGYAVVILCLIWVGKPYVYRRMVDWATATPARWTQLCLGGIVYGAAILICAICWW
ncbi:MAG: hypothetical protein RR553_09125 [Akkermansia sp.]